MNKISKGNMLLFITTVLFYGMSFVSGYLAYEVADPMVLQVLTQTLLFIPAMIYALIKRQSIPKMVRMKKTRPINFLMAVLVLACAYPVIIVINMISMIFVENAVADTMSFMLTNYGFFVPFFVVAIMPGFAEEFLFRGVAYSGYAKSHPIAGLLISSAAFGLMHGNFNQLPYAIFLGALFVLMLEATDSIWITMFMHFLLNGSNIVMMYLLGPEAYASDVSAVSVRDMFAQMAAESGVVILIGVFFIYALLAIFFAAAAISLVYLTFVINKRSPKETFLRKTSETNNRPLDFWLLGFVVVMILVMILLK